MIKVDVDAREAIRFNERNMKALGSFSERAVAQLKEAVRRERSGHKYTNRTEHLEQSTEIVGHATGGECDVDVQQTAAYASYLNDSPKKWSRFTEHVEAALGRIWLKTWNEETRKLSEE